MMNPADVSFDPLYIMSTYLSPAYKEVQNEEQTTAVKRNLLKRISPQFNNVPRQNKPHASQEDNVGTEDEDYHDLEVEEPSSKRFKHLMGLLKGKQKAKRVSSSSSSSRSAEEIEIENYAHSFRTCTDEDEDPIVFWQNNSSMYTLTSCFAFDLLLTPASTAPVERIFSTDGNAKMGKRNCLTAQNLEREIMIAQNKRYLQLL